MTYEYEFNSAVPERCVRQLKLRVRKSFGIQSSFAAKQSKIYFDTTNNLLATTSQIICIGVGLRAGTCVIHKISENSGKGYWKKFEQEIAVYSQSDARNAIATFQNQLGPALRLEPKCLLISRRTYYLLTGSSIPLQLSLDYTQILTLLGKVVDAFCSVELECNGVSPTKEFLTAQNEIMRILPSDSTPFESKYQFATSLLKQK